MVISTEKKVRDISVIDAEIEATRLALANVKGTETEVYARIVGYYRSVRNWNKGKRNEYDIRKMFVYDNTDNKSLKSAPISQDQYMLTNADSACNCSEVVNVTEIEKMANSEIAYYEFFARNTCPNCPPVKSYLEQINIEGKRIDVDTDEGLSRAAAMGVCAAPTVIFYNSENIEVSRIHNVQELATFFEQFACKTAC